jgi:hypothetical protein
VGKGPLEFRAHALHHPPDGFEQGQERRGGLFRDGVSDIRCGKKKKKKKEARQIFSKYPLSKSGKANHADKGISYVEYEVFPMRVLRAWFECVGEVKWWRFGDEWGGGTL